MNAADHHDDTIHRTINAVWRIESARLIAGLVRMVRDVGLAEDLAQDALLAALERWPQVGVPDNPGAWLMATAKHRAIDRMRHNKLAQAKHLQITQALEDAQEDVVAGIEATLDDDIGDDLLRLVFIACHPVLSTDAQVALTLRLLGGLTTDEIARAFLQPEATIAQRIVRAKRSLEKARAPFEVPGREERAARLASVLGVIYLIFNEGYSATSGDHWMRPQLCEEALRLGRVLAGLAPDDAEVHGLLALMELQASRTHARIGPRGEPVLLPDQDRALWNEAQIQRGMSALEQAQRLGGGAGYYALQAAIAACHMRARTAAETDWERIVLLYDALMQTTPSPIVALNRAVAVSMAQGPAAGLDALDAIATPAADGALAGYHLLHSVRGELLMKMGNFPEARKEIERAIGMTKNLREQELLTEKLKQIEKAAQIRTH